MPIASLPSGQPAGVVSSANSVSNPTSLSFKVVLLGDASVGKTSLALRFSRDEFATSYKQTIGVDFFIRRIKLPGGITVTVQLWDIGGNTISNKMAANYVFGCQAALLVYDITHYQSFVNVEEWLNLVRKVCGEDAMPYMALVANKIDLIHLKAVKNNRHKDFTDLHNVYSYVVSAKTGESIAATLYRIASDLAGVPLMDDEIQELIQRDYNAQDTADPTLEGGSTGDEQPGGATGSSKQQKAGEGGAAKCCRCCTLQ